MAERVPCKSVPCCQCDANCGCKTLARSTRRSAALTSRIVPRFHLSDASLEVEFQCELHQTRIASAFDAPKVCPIGHVSINVHKLRVVEDVKYFRAELEAIVFAKRGIF